MSDEYGAYVYRFTSSGDLIQTIQPPKAILPFQNGTLNFTSEVDPTTGRVGNQGTIPDRPHSLLSRCFLFGIPARLTPSALLHCNYISLTRPLCYSLKFRFRRVDSLSRRPYPLRLAAECNRPGWRGFQEHQPIHAPPRVRRIQYSNSSPPSYWRMGCTSSSK